MVYCQKIYYLRTVIEEQSYGLKPNNIYTFIFLTFLITLTNKNTQL